MSSDASFTYLHFHDSFHADLQEEYSKPRLPAEEIVVPEQYRPDNPEDEEDIVPDQRAAFGIQRATQKTKEPAWRDLGLERLLISGPPTQNASSSQPAASMPR